MLMLLPLVAGAQVFMNDTFTDGGRTDGADAQDVAWYTTSGGTLSVADNATIGSGNALTFNPRTVDVNASPKYQQRIVGQFGSTATLTNAGDWIKLSFNITVDTNNPLATASIRTLRFGLFNSNATAFSADAYDVNRSGAASNDQGYMAALSVVNSVRGDLLAEQAGADTTFMGGATAPLTVFTNATLPGINENQNYAMSLIVTRLTSAADSNVSVEYLQDGVSTLINLKYTGSGKYFSFDEVGFAGGVATTPFSFLDFTIDNVVVQTPEPATMSILALGTLLLTRFQRRRK